jgi:adenylate cyclase
LPQGQRKLAAIMFTDIVGYTALGQRNESISIALVEEQKNLIRPILGRHDGKEIKTIGDSFLVEFPNALEAVRCAYDIQRSTKEFNVSMPEDKSLHLRIGVHLGDVVESQGDISGDAVNVASRIEALADDGGVCVTRAVHESVHSKIGVAFVSLGAKSLKNVNEPMEVYKMKLPWNEGERTGISELEARRIAVLPFASLSPDPNDEYFADGLTEELIDRLSQLRELEVIARTSVMNYKRKEKNASQIGRELRAGSLVEGSVRKAGNRIRVTAQLINSSTEGHLWSSSYDRNLDDVFAVQSDIAQRVADSMKVKLLEDEVALVSKVPTKSVSAHESYLRGLFLMNKGFNRGEYSFGIEAVKHFEHSIREDPDFALAYAALGNLHVALAGDAMPVREAFEKAEKLIVKASALDDKSSDIHLAKGNLALQYHMEYAMAQAEFKRAIDLNPSNSEAHMWYSTFHSLMGNFQGAIEEAVIAHELDPLSIRPRSQIAYNYFLMRDYSTAAAEYEKIIQLEPDSVLYHLNLASDYYYGGMSEPAKKELDVALELKPDKYMIDFVAWELAILGRVEEARKILHQMENGELNFQPSPTHLATVYTALGDKEKALSLLEEDFDQNPAMFLFRFRIAAFDPLRGDPRFISLVRRLNLPEN